MSGWNFTKGNLEQGPTVHRSESPIRREDIGDDIIGFLKQVSLENATLIDTTDFQMEFLCYGETVAFIKLDILSGNKKQIDVKLMGDEAKHFVELIRATRFDESAENPPNSN